RAKLAGILTEGTRASASRLSRDPFVVVVGIGINLNGGAELSHAPRRPIAESQQFCDTIPKAANHSHEHLVAVIAHRWQQQLNTVTNSGFINSCDDFHAIDYLYGMPINILTEGMITQSGIAAGINAYGQLQIRSGKHTQAISVGEVSVRPQHDQGNVHDEHARTR